MGAAGRVTVAGQAAGAAGRVVRVPVTGRVAKPAGRVAGLVRLAEAPGWMVRAEARGVEVLVECWRGVDDRGEEAAVG
jgi:hypothetical protein